MDLVPSHRLPFQLPEPWPACAHGMLQAGATWLHTGTTGEGLLALPGPAHTSRWDGQAWITSLGSLPLLHTPWEALEAALTDGPCPWIGAATFELACDEAGLPRKPLPAGQLGQHWTAVHEALHWQRNEAELWSWGSEPPDPEAWRNRLARPLTQVQLPWSWPRPGLRPTTARPWPASR